MRTEGSGKMNGRVMSLIFAGALAAAAVGCGGADQTPGGGVSPSPEVGLANPASVHCEEQGGREETPKDDGGGEYAVCVFPNGSECESWAFYRGECKPEE